MFQELQMATQKVGLRINYSKTKLLTNLFPSELIQVERMHIKKYIYLGHEMRISRNT